MSQFASLPPKSASRSNSDETSGSRTGRRKSGADPIEREAERERYLEEGRGRDAGGGERETGPRGKVLGDISSLKKKRIDIYVKWLLPRVTGCYQTYPKT